MRRIDQGRVLGPYKERNGKWRILLVHPNGYRQAKLYCSKDKALRGMPRALAELQSRLQLGPQIEPFVATLAERGLANTTIAAHRAFLVAMFSGECANMWNPLRVEETLVIWARIWSVATRRLNLWRADKFWSWLVGQGKVATNPWAGRHILGRANRGKPQLRLDEARRLCQAALTLYAEGKTLALAPVVALSMGLRSGEMLKRVARDVDDGGALLWIPFGKNANARRHLDVPLELQPLLADLVRGKDPQAPIFGLNKKGKPWRAPDLHQLMLRLCDLAKVPRVCPHSLRGLWASLALRSGVAAQAVASALGHGSFEMTAKHYAAPGALEGARSETTSSQLFPKPPA